MIYKSISAKHLIWRVGRTFNIQSSDWISDAYEFIFNGLRELNVYQSLEPCHKVVAITDYRITLPCDISILGGITYKGERLKFFRNINKYYIKMLDKYPVSNHTCQLIPNGTIETSIPSCTIESKDCVVHYMKIPSEYDTELETDIPLVPDSEPILDALTWYLLYHILLRGYIHPSIKWSDALEMWENKKWAAINRATMPDEEERQLHSLIWRSMYVNMNAWSDSFHRQITRS